MDKLPAWLQSALEVVGHLLDWLGRVDDIVTLFMLTVACVIVGIVLGYLGQVSFGWRGRLYGAMMSGMIINMVAKFEETSYEGALVIMLVVTALAFFIGQGTGLKFLRGYVKRKPDAG